MTLTLQVYPGLSPRIIKILSPDTEITMQQLVDKLRDWEDEPWNMSYSKIISATGKQALGGGVTVGITAQLQNAKIEFESRTTSFSNGTATSNNTTGTILTDTGATFITDGIALGATIINFTDKSVGTVLSIDSNTQITHEKLSDGSLNTWIIGDEYKIWNEIQCEASGGNLVALDSTGATMSPIMPSAFTQIVKTSSASATLSDLEAIQYSSYQNRVTIDIVNGTPGTAYPIGTAETPVNTLSQAKTIAVNKGFTKLSIIGDITIGATDTVSNYDLYGQMMQHTNIILTSGRTTDMTIFRDATMSGRQNGKTHYHDCELGDMSNLHCFLERCSLIGPLQMHPTAQDTGVWVNCYSAGGTTLQSTTVDMNNGPMNLSIRNFSGKLNFINCTNSNADIGIDMISGQITIDASCTSGDFEIRGTGNVINNSTSNVTDDTSGTTTITNTIWDEPVSSHTTSGSVGYVMGKIMTVSKFLGLK